MMTNNLSKRDWETLSSYIDDQLKPRERAHLEARLAGEPALQAGLYELEQTRAMLRQLPNVRAPRNFTLTPEMAGPRPFSLRIYPVFQYATVVATFLFAMVYALQFGDIITFDNRLENAAMEAPPAAMVEPAELLGDVQAEEEAESDTSKAEEGGPTALQMESSSADALGEEPSLAPETFMETTEDGQEKIGPGEEARGTEAEGELTTEGLVVTKIPPATATPKPSPTPEPTAIPTLVPTPEPTFTPTPTGVLESTPLLVPQWIPWFLGIFALWTGLLAVFFRWRQS